ncbi:hypothetical protein ABK040_007600 [Willaertia magna]
MLTSPRNRTNNPEDDKATAAALLSGTTTPSGTIEGELFRRSLFSAWRRVFAVLKEDGTFFHYKDKPYENSLRDQFSIREGNIIQIVNAENIVGQACTILILFLNKPPLLLRAKDKVDHQRWITGLIQCYSPKDEKFKTTNLLVESFLYSPIPYLIASQSGEIESFNAPLPLLFGYNTKNDEVKGKNISSLSEEILQEIKKKKLNIPREILCIRKNKENFFALCCAYEIEMFNESIATTIINNNSTNNNNNSKSKLLIFFHDTEKYDEYAEEDFEEMKDGIYKAQQFTPSQPNKSKNGNSQHMRLFLKITGISPFVLRLNNGLQIHHYQKIANQYYTDKLYNKKPPSQIFLAKVVNFPNGDKYMEFKRRQIASDTFSLETQQKMLIYNEPEPCDESIIMQKSPIPEIFVGDLPKTIGLNRLILLMTDPYAPSILEDIFWFTYRSVLKPKVVLQKLIERFEVPSIKSDDLVFTDVERVYYNTTIAQGIKRKVLLTLSRWVKNYYFDFEQKMITVLEEFIQKVDKKIKGEGSISFLCNNIDLGLSNIVEQIKHVMKKNDRHYEWQKAKDFSSLFTLILNKKARLSITMKKELNILEMPVKEIAEQLTFMDNVIYNEIKFSELLDQSWMKEKRKHQAPNLLSNVGFFNKISNWVCVSILSEENQMRRVRILRKMLHLLGALHEMNSFNLAMAVSGGLGETSVHRLTNTWDEIEEKTLEIQHNCLEFTSPKGNYKQFRAATNECFVSGKSCVPYIGIYLKDLVFTDDGNPAFVDGKINFTKCINTYAIMFQVLRFQGRNYNIEPNPDFIKEILTFDDKKYSEDARYEMSLKIQPKK